MASFPSYGVDSVPSVGKVLIDGRNQMHLAILTRSHFSVQLQDITYQGIIRTTYSEKAKLEDPANTRINIILE